MACAVLHNIAQERQEPDPEEDDLVELENREKHFPEVERDGLTARDYMAQTYFA